MSSSNLLEPLVSVIETVRRRIKDHGASLRENETRTRVALIDPILQALGWDVSDPTVVTPEFPVSASRADYALLGPGGNALVALEAKRLGESLAPHRQQMVNYVNTEGIGYAGLTDGANWEVYRVFTATPLPLSERMVMSTNILGTQPHESALKLLSLWRINVGSGQPVGAQEPLIGFPDPNNGEPPVPPKPPQPTADPPGLIPSPKPSEEGNWVPLSDFVAKSSSKPPARIRFGSDTIYELPRWRSIIDATTHWLFDSGQLTPEKVPLRYGMHGGMINTTPTRSDGTNFASSYQVPSQPIYVDVHGRALTIVRRALAILVALSVDPSDIYVEPR